MSFDPTPFVPPAPPRSVQPGGTEPGFARLEPLIQPEQLRSQFLFGLRLKSNITQQELQDPDLKSIIARAMSRVEHEAHVDITPVKYSELFDYNLFDYQKWAFIQLNHWPVQTVESFRAIYPFSDQFIEFPTDWISIYNETGLIQLVPKNGSFSQFLITRDASLLPLILGGRMQWPQLFNVTYQAGFELDKVPAILNELIGTYAALDVLEMLDSVTFLGSYSIGIDGASQGVGLPGPGWLQNRINSLKEKSKELTDSIKRYYNHSILISSLG